MAKLPGMNVEKARFRINARKLLSDLSTMNSLRARIYDLSMQRSITEHDTNHLLDEWKRKFSEISAEIRDIESYYILYKKDPFVEDLDIKGTIHLLKEFLSAGNAPNPLSTDQTDYIEIISGSLRVLSELE